MPDSTVPDSITQGSTEQPATEQPATEQARVAVGQACLSCGSPQARMWSTPDGPARLCPPCATLHGLGCP